VKELVFAALLAGCFDSASHDCGNGTVCPPALSCQVGGGCYDPQQCQAGDGAPCGANGTCEGGACVGAVCGDGVIERGETCDDGNFLSHDGCSSRCEQEAPECVTAGVAMSNQCFGGTGLLFVEEARGRVVVVRPASGTDCGTFAVEQNALTPIAPFPGPSRTNSAVASDRAHGRTVMFGGTNFIGPSGYADTWLWDGTAWTQASPSRSPPARDSHAMAGLGDGHIVMFGGESATAMLGDTWTWDGVTWKSEAPATSPLPRYLHAMAYDPIRGVAVLQGGVESGGGSPSGETWTWDGTAWSLVTGATLPRDEAAIAFDAARGRLVAVGGAPNHPPAEELDGATWHELSSASCAEFAVTAGMLLTSAYDPLGRRLLVLDDSAGQLWQVRWDVPNELEESCVAGEDADGDGLAGCADPDCWGYCTPFCPPGAPCDPSLPHCGDGQCNADLEQAACPQDCP
jgi:cysteine-rich repeat protein